jgi:hypothetical protein
VKPDNINNAHDRGQDESREVRARCWSYIFACFEARKTSEQSDQEATKEVEHVRAEGSTPWR